MATEGHSKGSAMYFTVFEAHRLRFVAPQPISRPRKIHIVYHTLLASNRDDEKSRADIYPTLEVYRAGDDNSNDRNKNLIFRILCGLIRIMADRVDEASPLMHGDWLCTISSTIWICCDPHPRGRDVEKRECQYISEADE
ncbi:hypothetical protein PM082_019681 [Marasmius tenuissimus]|nr:hypothetical protein PM082_019681 [Marasmius tenuissimus]